MLCTARLPARIWARSSVLGVFGALAHRGRRFGPVRTKRINVCIYKVAICSLYRVNRKHAFITFSIITHCLHFLNCGLGCIHGVASVSSGVVGHTGRGNRDFITLISHVVTRVRGSFSTLGVLHPSVRPHTARRVTRVVRLARRLVTGNRTCITSGNSIVFSIPASPACNILSHRSLSRLRTNTHISIISSGHGPVSFIL